MDSHQVFNYDHSVLTLFQISFDITKIFAPSQIIKNRCYFCVGLLVLTTYSVSILGIAMTGQAKSLTIPVGIYPAGIAVDARNSNVYVANFNSGTVSVINSSGTVIATTLVGKQPTGVVYDTANKDLYVINSGSNNVYVLQSVTMKLAKVIPVASNPIAATYDFENNCIYVASYQSNTVSQINGSTNKVVAFINVGHPDALTYDPDNGGLYVANRDSNSVSVINAATRAVVAEIPVGTNPTAIFYNSANQGIYVANKLSNDVFLINGSKNQVVGKPVAVGAEPLGLAINPKKHMIYVSNSLSNTVSVINAVLNNLKYDVPVGSLPSGLAFDQNKNKVYVSNSASNTVFVIDNKSKSTASQVVVTFKVNPSKVGYIKCGDAKKANTFADNQYHNYSFFEKLNCQSIANASSNYNFISWSGLYSGSKNPISFTVPHVDSKLIANFKVSSQSGFVRLVALSAMAAITVVISAFVVISLYIIRRRDAKRQMS